MWYKEKKHFADQLKPIDAVKPLVKKRHFEVSGRIIDKTDYSNLHDCYVLTLRQISPKTKLPHKPVSMRVVESDENGHIAFHEVGVNPKNPKLQTTFLTESKILNFERAVARIKTMHKDESEGEIRLLSVPALNIEALWLHFEDGAADKFSLKVVYNPKDDQLFTRNQFLAFLYKRKKELLDQPIGKGRAGDPWGA